MAQLPNLGLTSMVRQATGTVSAVLQSAEIFSSYIEKVKADQAIDHKIHRENYASKAIERAALSEAERILELDEFSSKSDRHHELLTTSMAKYHKLIHGEIPKSVEPEEESE